MYSSAAAVAVSNAEREYGESDVEENHGETDLVHRQVADQTTAVLAGLQQHARRVVVGNLRPTARRKNPQSSTMEKRTTLLEEKNSSHLQRKNPQSSSTEKPTGIYNGKTQSSTMEKRTALLQGKNPQPIYKRKTQSSTAKPKLASGKTQARPEQKNLNLLWRIY